jgi:hypothetical protein
MPILQQYESNVHAYKNKENHLSNNTHIEHFQTRTKRLWSKVYQEK